MKANKSKNKNMKHKPVPGSPKTQFDGVDRSGARYYQLLASGKTAFEASTICKREAAKAAGISLKKANEILADEAQ